MNDRTTILAGAAVGALVGAAAAYLVLTPRGRRLRAEVEPVLRELLAELGEPAEAPATVRPPRG